MLAAQRKLFLHLGRNIHKLRLSRKLTQEKLAELSDLNPRTLQKVEAGELNLLVGTLGRIREALNCSWKDLLD